MCEVNRICPTAIPSNVSGITCLSKDNTHVRLRAVIFIGFRLKKTLNKNHFIGDIILESVYEMFYLSLQQLLKNGRKLQVNTRLAVCISALLACQIV